MSRALLGVGFSILCLAGCQSPPSGDDDTAAPTSDDAGEMTFAGGEPSTLGGTLWQVRSYDGGEHGMVDVLVGTTLSARFDDGKIGGSAGCNNFNAGYETDGDAITIGPAASTRMMCGEPEGVMEQETLFLTALQTAATYTIEGNHLQLRSTDGTPAVDLFAAEVTPE